MALDYKVNMDTTDYFILRILQENARRTFSDIGREIGLSPPAVAERVRKMGDAGVITGYSAQINLEKIGLRISAFLMLKTRADRYPGVVALVERMPEVLECHHVSGEDSFILKVAAKDVGHLETLISRISPYGETNTLIVLSSPVVKRDTVRSRK
jgi:Lrp/AsnC family transcriptional regulator, leucine-responsive regulatory protein